MSSPQPPFEQNADPQPQHPQSQHLPGYEPQGYGPQGYGPQGYGPQGYGASRGTNGMAIASMVLGILWIYWIGSVLALIFGYIARRQIKQRNESGGGMAVAGIVLGWVGIAALILVLVLVLFAFNSGGSSGGGFSDCVGTGC